MTSDVDFGPKPPFAGDRATLCKDFPGSSTSQWEAKPLNQGGRCNMLIKKHLKTASRRICCANFGNEIARVRAILAPQKCEGVYGS